LENALKIAIKNALLASFFAAVFVAGCESQPAAGPVAVRVAPVASPSSAPPGQGNFTSPAPATSGDFSLPIGADIPPLAEETANAPIVIPPLAQAPSNVAGQQPQHPQQPLQVPPTPAQGALPANSPATNSGSSIHLSAGIAVPQSLPIGTVMAISVDYSLRSELRASQYVLVVKSSAGEIVNEVKLESSGNLSAFFQQLRPEHRPFSVRIEEVIPGSKRRAVISNELTLKTDY
jgi:hypothetical protein